MKRVAVVGKSTRDKSFLIMYLGKLLSQSMDVGIVTEDQWFMPEISSFEYSEQLTIVKEEPEDLAWDLLIMDVTGHGPVVADKYFFVTEIDRLTVEANEGLFEAHKEENLGIYLFINVLMDGKINEKYLCDRFALNRKSTHVMTLYLDDGDMAVHIENSYNESLDMRWLSKTYKKMLMILADNCVEEDMKQLKRWMRLAERGK